MPVGDTIQTSSGIFLLVVVVIIFSTVIGAVRCLFSLIWCFSWDCSSGASKFTWWIGWFLAAMVSDGVKISWRLAAKALSLSDCRGWAFCISAWSLPVVSFTSIWMWFVRLGVKIILSGVVWEIGWKGLGCRGMSPLVNVLIKIVNCAHWWLGRLCIFISAMHIYISDRLCIFWRYQ